MLDEIVCSTTVCATSLIKSILNMIEGVSSMYRFLEKVIAITGVHGHNHSQLKSLQNFIDFRINEKKT